MSNLASIGFIVNSQEEFLELGEKLFAQGKEVSKDYILYNDNLGVQIWFQINKQKQIIGFNPHFVGKSKNEIYLKQKILNKETQEGYLIGSVSEEIGKETSAEFFPIIFAVPNYQIIGNRLNLPKKFNIQLTAFPSEMKYYENKEIAEKESKLAIRAFIPSGLFSSEQKQSFKPEGVGIFSGVIKEVNLLFNSFSNKNFYHLLVSSLNLDIDVVCEEKELPKDLKVGGIISGQFLISGYILNEEELEKEVKGNKFINYLKSFFK